VACFAGAFFAGAAAAAPAPVPVDAGAQARKILSDSGYQRAFPGAPPEREESGSVWRRHHPGDVAPGDGGLRKGLEMPEGVAVLIEWVLMLLAIAVVGLVAVWAFRSMRDGGFRRAEKARRTAGETPERRRENGAAVSEDADRLAAQERWADALHAFLL